MSRALLIVDIQKDYFPGGRMELVGAEAAAGRAAELLSAFRESGEPVFHIQHVWDAPDAPFFAPGTEGVEIHSSVTPASGEPVITKEHANAFLKTSLTDDLRTAGVEDVVICPVLAALGSMVAQVRDTSEIIGNR